jgi:hypothetical protein
MSEKNNTKSYEIPVSGTIGISYTNAKKYTIRITHFYPVIEL